jgi:hypothetical protein
MALPLPSPSHAIAGILEYIEEQWAEKNAKWEREHPAQTLEASRRDLKVKLTSRIDSRVTVPNSSSFGFGGYVEGISYFQESHRLKKAPNDVAMAFFGSCVHSISLTMRCAIYHAANSPNVRIIPSNLFVTITNKPWNTF